MTQDSANSSPDPPLERLLQRALDEAAALEAALPAEAAQVLHHMDLPYVPVFTDVLYRAVREATTGYGASAEAVYSTLLERLGNSSDRHARPSAAEERRDHDLLRLFQTTVGWRLQRLVEAPPSWPEADGSRRAAFTTEPEAPRIAIIVLSCNRLAYLRNTLHAIHQTLEHPNCELIVLDNGSTDGTVEWLERALELGLLSRLILAEKNLGNARGFNVARAHAHPEPDLTIKLDSDICPLTVGWERRLLRLAQASPDTGLVGLSQRNHYVLRTAPSLENGDEAVIPWSSWVVGSCMGIPRSTFARLGYFTEPEGMVYSWDDLDYWMRAVRAGFHGYYLRDAAVAHQTAFDQSLYQRGVGAKNLGAVRALVRRHAREYDLGSRELESFPQRYTELEIPAEPLVYWNEDR